MIGGQPLQTTRDILELGVAQFDSLFLDEGNDLFDGLAGACLLLNSGLRSLNSMATPFDGSHMPMGYYISDDRIH